MSEEKPQAPESAAKPDVAAVSAPNPELDVLREQLAKSHEQIKSLRDELQSTLTTQTQSAEESYKRALALKESEYKAELQAIQERFHSKENEWTEKMGNYRNKLSALSIENQIRSGEVKFKDDAIDLIKLRVNQDVSLDPITGEVTFKTPGVESMSQYLQKLADEKPSLVQSKITGGSGDSTQARKFDGASGGDILPAGFASWPQHERVKWLSQNPEAREALKQQRNKG